MSFKSIAQQFINDEDGVTVIEYALIAGLISVVAIAAFTTVGEKVTTIMEKVAASLTTAAAK